MSFQLPPIPEAVLNTEVTITSNSGRDDFGNLLPDAINKSMFRYEFEKLVNKTEEGLNIRYIINLFCNKLDFVVNEGDNVSFVIPGYCSIKGEVQSVSFPPNPNGSIHHFEIVVGEVTEHEL
ncbi:hypothetical protein ACFO0V_003175 [Listeria monocytogenes]|nr:hypothetical protein [Listeria monocytogenes]EAC8479902.1 hypothetical protein [Listeria monocytogenes]EAE8199178.1 hypothetical protein [Listeria monocytogenes]EAE8226282.1 hypothetical protein [Listeria monocytogenes]EAE8284706.1 hypothetical protein [Listeria monocytogenes]